MKNSNDRGSVIGCIVRRVETASFFAISLLALTLWCSLGALGQEVRPQSTSSTELGRENLARVAASVGEIKLLLLKDSGLLVEVKRWMAKEATSNGQVISDLDLTDDAIFDRLVTDIPFRSAVTLILQKYGHLLPKLDPESEAAKERDLTLQERARMLAQAHQSEMASLQQSAVPGKWYSNSCDPQKTDKCQAPSDANTEYPGIHEYVSPPSTTPELPMRPGSPNRSQDRPARCKPVTPTTKRSFYRPAVRKTSSRRCAGPGAQRILRISKVPVRRSFLVRVCPRGMELSFWPATMLVRMEIADRQARKAKTQRVI